MKARALITASEEAEIKEIEKKNREEAEVKRMAVQSEHINRDNVAVIGDEAQLSIEDVGDDDVLTLELVADGSPETSVARPVQRSSSSMTPAERAAEAKKKAEVRQRRPVPGHTILMCNSFEETPRKKKEMECASCACIIPAHEPIDEVASCRCVLCATVFCYLCAIARLPVKPTPEHPFLERLPPPQAKERRMV